MQRLCFVGSTFTITYLHHDPGQTDFDLFGELEGCSTRVGSNHVGWCLRVIDHPNHTLTAVLFFVGLATAIAIFEKYQWKAGLLYVIPMVTIFSIAFASGYKLLFGLRRKNMPEYKRKDDEDKNKPHSSMKNTLAELAFALEEQTHQIAKLMEANESLTLANQSLKLANGSVKPAVLKHTEL
eukprot:m.68515 g.68515  ORF g.68515 m.68515 type:complete len:182 (+) comp23964_c0_seq1:360-905(+)